MIFRELKRFHSVKFTSFVVLFSLFFFAGKINAQSNEDCLACHSDKTLTKIRDKKTVSLFVDESVIGKSRHGKLPCISCHTEAKVTDFPHPENMEVVNCGSCHKKAEVQYALSIHGQAMKFKAPYAPDCKECHGTHDVLSRTNPKSTTYKMNVPVLCGKCHKEGAPVARLYNINKHNILENYKESIHGKGLYEKGLMVTATCNDCHGNHLILPHTNPKASTNSTQIAGTCMKCHANIELVHKKVVKRELWEKKAGNVPACNDCHSPHTIKVQKAETVISNQVCLNCHSSDKAFKIENSKKHFLNVNTDDFINSAHKNFSCNKCHTDVTEYSNGIRPCIPVKKVDCSICHEATSNVYIKSDHGKAYFNNKESNAPYCTNCHGTHKVLSRYADSSATNRANIPQLCGKCHTKNGKAVINTHLKEIDAFSDYSSSVHGKGLNEKGLLGSAVCIDCHTSHNILKEANPNSSVNPRHIPETCGQCHKSIYNKYIGSDHSILKNTADKKFPTCVNCHTAHTITEIDKDQFLTEITLQCGSCHEDLSESYMETYHGKAYSLGYLKSARCSDCHGAHDILNVSNPESSVGQKNIVKTCKKCHENATAEFTGYLTHATHNNNKVLYYTFWAMTSLLFAVFGFFGLHTLLWLPRSIIEARKKKRHAKPEGSVKYFRRFTKSQRITHIFVIISFLSLATTGMMLKFAHMGWAITLAKIIGGVDRAGNIHRFAALITFGYFIFHIISLFKLKKEQKLSLKDFVFGPNSLMFNKHDIKDFIGTVKWFLGFGVRPKYGRWTYWEKFDYMAVFWGVAVIGFSGLVLWFPVFFTHVFPGWMINIAQIIHSDEALMAVVFIFTIHFFNTHLRPEAFPMDTVIFTGHVELEDYKADRPKEWEEIENKGNEEKYIVKKEIPTSRMKAVKFFGYLFLFTGIILVILIIFSLITGKY